MVDEPDNSTLQLLREIWQSQSDIKDALSGQGDRLAPIEQRIDELRATMDTVPGFAIQANVRRDTVTSRLSTWERRVRHLEEKV